MVPDPNCYDDYKCRYPPCHPHVHRQTVLLSAIHLHDLEVQVDTFHQHTAEHSQKKVMEQHSNHVAYNLSKCFFLIRYSDKLDQPIISAQQIWSNIDLLRGFKTNFFLGGGTVFPLEKREGNLGCDDIV